MTDITSTQVIINGHRNLVMKFTNDSDGTGETGVVKVDATSPTFGSPGIHLKVARITYDIKGGSVQIQWVSAVNSDMMVLGGFETQDFKRFGGLTNPNNNSANGSIAFTTVGFVFGSSYSIVLEMIKGI